MNCQTMKLSAALVITAISTLNFASSARAGEGGVAGAAAFTINNNQVIGVAVSAAVGKDNAAASAFNYAPRNNNMNIQNSAFAVGSSGQMTVRNIGNPENFGITVAPDANRGTAQDNRFNQEFSIQLGTQSGNAVVTTPTNNNLPRWYYMD